MIRKCASATVDQTRLSIRPKTPFEALSPLLLTVIFQMKRKPVLDVIDMRATALYENADWGLIHC